MLTPPPRVAQTLPQSIQVAMERVELVVAAVAAAALVAKCGRCRRSNSSSSKELASTTVALTALEIQP